MSNNPIKEFYPYYLTVIVVLSCQVCTTISYQKGYRERDAQIERLEVKLEQCQGQHNEDEWQLDLADRWIGEYMDEVHQLQAQLFECREGEYAWMGHFPCPCEESE